jgi:hypothetical protein
MAKTFPHRASNGQHYRHFVMQKLLVERTFPAFRCSLRRGLLECTGVIQPSDDSDRYTVQIRYTEWGVPEVRILKPTITPRSKIHMYRDGRLCLYHPPTQPWLGANDLHKTIIPWTAEWLVYYELYLSEGKWLGPEVPHGEPPLE